MSGGLTKGKSNRHSKNKNYYASGFNRTIANKAKRAKRRAAWLAHRQDADTRLRMAARWVKRHPVGDVICFRYGWAVQTTTKHVKAVPNA